MTFHKLLFVIHSYKKGIPVISVGEGEFSRSPPNCFINLHLPKGEAGTFYLHFNSSFPYSILSPYLLPNNKYHIDIKGYQVLNKSTDVFK